MSEPKISQIDVDKARAELAQCDKDMTNAVWCLPLHKRALTFLQLDRNLPGFGDLRQARAKRAAARRHLRDVYRVDADQDMGR